MIGTQCGKETAAINIRLTLHNARQEREEGIESEKWRKGGRGRKEEEGDRARERAYQVHLLLYIFISHRSSSHR